MRQIQANNVMLRPWRVRLPSGPLAKGLLDLSLWIVALPVALLLRLDVQWAELTDAILFYALISTPMKSALLAFGRTHRSTWHHTGPRDVWGLVRLIGFGTLGFFALNVLSPLSLSLPISVPLIEGATALLLMVGARFGRRLHADNSRSRNVEASRRVLVIGAGEAGALAVREMLRHPDQGMLPVALLDDAPSKLGTFICGVQVVGCTEQLGVIASRLRADQVLIAMPSAARAKIHHLRRAAETAKLTCQIVPGMYEILSGRVNVMTVRDVKVEEVLNRPPVQLNTGDIEAYLTGQVVLVTGAGGSIGSEIVRQVVAYNPQLIVLFGRGENSLFAIQQELARKWPDVAHKAVIGDVRHASHLRKVFETYQPTVVVHAAAHKHVPLMEDSPSEAIYNNIIGTRVVSSLCLEFNVRRFINISTDKAVNPTSVMGSCKRIAEMVVCSAAKCVKREEQAFVSVRFGNVLGSRGSVVPTFMQQIRDGGPVTITHPQMVRYFMTIPEAAQLVLQAGALAHNGCVYVLDMGKPVKIVDLARNLIHLSGSIGVDITFTGIRPGEKLYEELLTTSDQVDATTHRDIFIARPDDTDDNWLVQQLSLLERYARDEDYVQIRRMLRDLIPESQLQTS